MSDYHDSICLFVEISQDEIIPLRTPMIFGGDKGDSVVTKIARILAVALFSFIGSPLLELLLSAGWKVWCL